MSARMFQSKVAVLFIAAILLAALLLIDRLTGSEIGFPVFYLAPISIVTWRFGRTAGIVLCLVCAVGNILADILAGRQYSHQALLALDVVLHFATYTIFAFALSALKRALDRERHLARHDTLTGLLNRHGFFIEVERVLPVSSTTRGHTL